MGKKRSWSKVGRSSKNTGKAFERQIAKWLTKMTGIKLDRVPDSGARFWPGDIWCGMNPRVFPFYVECRRRKEGTPWAVLRSDLTVPPLSWWNETDFACETPVDCGDGGHRVYLQPMVVWKPALEIGRVFVMFRGSIFADNEDRESSVLKLLDEDVVIVPQSAIRGIEDGEVYLD